MAVPYRPREVWWNLLMKHVKYGLITAAFCLKRPNGVQTR